MKSDKGKVRDLRKALHNETIHLLDNGGVDKCSNDVTGKRCILGAPGIATSCTEIMKYAKAAAFARYDYRVLSCTARIWQWK